MEIWNQIWFFLAGLGVFNGLLLVGYCFFILRSKQWRNVLFGLLMLMLCIRIGKSLFHIFTDVARIYRQIGLSACIMIGPLLYLYINTLLGKTYALPQIRSVHLWTPLVSIITIGVIWPYETHPDLWNNYIVQGIYAVWILYLIAGFVLVLPIVRKAIQQQLSILDSWILLLYSCILVLCIAYNLALYGFSYLAGPLLFSVVLYLMMAFLAAKKNRAVVFQEVPPKYQNQKLSEPEANDILERLTALMQTQQPYLNPKVKLATIAQSINSSPHDVSQVINDRLGISFNQYINEFRIKEACLLLSESDLLTVEGIGQEVGFTSRSAFYSAFKTQMQLTPGQYKAKKKPSIR